MNDYAMKDYTVFDTAADLNSITGFLSRRDINELTGQALYTGFGILRADLLIILGSSIPYLAELGASAFLDGVAKGLMIVGGIGHSTKYLAENIRNNPEYGGIDVDCRPEADILKEVVSKKAGLNVDSIIIENRSTNCGENAVQALKVLKEQAKIPSSVIIIQDPTMQLRTCAAFLKAWSGEKTRIISYSPFIPHIKAEAGSLKLSNNIYGLWSFDRFIDLVMGEIPRLRDDEEGYGPKGKNFIVHVDIPDNVLEAYGRLQTKFSGYKHIMLRK